ncbi:MAG: agmatinase [Phormidesmis sp.]
MPNLLFRSAQSSSTVPFLGSEVAASYENARVAILPVPYEATTTYRQGCQAGPAAILEASHQVECIDEELMQESWPLGIYTHPMIAAECQGKAVLPTEMLALTRQAAQTLSKDGKFVIALGGEHSITAGLVAGYQASTDAPFTVVQIDAHGDLRHTYEGSIHNHACVMRRIVEMGLPTVQLGIRSLCQEEFSFVKENQLTVFMDRHIATDSDWIVRAITSIKTQKVFLTIDLDGIDPAIMPGVGTPEPGGIGWYPLLAFLRQLFLSHQVIGCDVMELAPIKGSVVSEFIAAKLVYKLIGYLSLAESSAQAA